VISFEKMPPGKGGNAKKESGRAKKAENEAKKQEAAAAQKVSYTTYTMLFMTTIFLNRNVLKPTNGKTGPGQARNKMTKKRNGKPNWHEKPRMHDC
jgi:hypothetical protein